MTVSLTDFYTAYAALEAYPKTAERDTAAAAASASAAARAHVTERGALARTHADRVASTEHDSAAEITRLASRLRALATSASANGVRAAAGAGRPANLDFDAAAATNTRLDALLLHKRRLEHDLHELEQLRRREADAAQARSNDTITLVIALAAIVVVGFVGPNALGSVIAAVSAVVVGRRLVAAPSAFMMRRTVRRPLLAHDRRARLGLVCVVGGLIALTALLLALAVSVAAGALPVPSGIQLPGMLPLIAPITGPLALGVCWATIAAATATIVIGATRMTAK